MSDLLGGKKIHKVTANIIGFIYDETRDLSLCERMFVMDYLTHIIETEAQAALEEHDKSVFEPRSYDE
jgi:hypothetical protein